MATGRYDRQSMWQWLSLMITIIAGLIGGYYTLDKRISLIEQRNDVKDREISDMQKTLTTGMQLRITLEGRVEAFQKTLNDVKQENKEAHTEIKESIQKLYIPKQVSAIPVKPGITK